MGIRVVIESPFRAVTWPEAKRNKAYLRRALLDSLDRGESPFASHAIYPLVLDDDDLAGRRRGLTAGWDWLAVADLVAVYEDWGVSAGMTEGLEQARQFNLPVDRRLIGR